jgi:hypothetical protein
MVVTESRIHDNIRLCAYPEVVNAHIVSAQTPVVAGSVKPPNINLAMEGPVRVASIVAKTGCAAAVPAVTRIKLVNEKKSNLLSCMSGLQ